MSVLACGTPDFSQLFVYLAGIAAAGTTTVAAVAGGIAWAATGKAATGMSTAVATAVIVPLLATAVIAARVAGF